MPAFLIYWLVAGLIAGMVGFPFAVLASRP